ncbi:MAG: sulfatase-like hydrolase/transferase [Ferruginibacter sp.]
MQYLRKIPLFPWLLVLFFCLHGSLENFDYLRVGEVLKLGGWLLLFITLAVLLIWRLGVPWELTTLLVFFISGWYLFFGALQDTIRATPWLHFLQSYTVLLPALLLVTIGWIIFLRRKPLVRPRLVFYFNLVLLIYCLIDGCLLLGDALYRKPARRDTVAFTYEAVKQKPNVYYLLLDEYPGYKSLKDSFGFANDKFYDNLHQQGLRFLPVNANYNFTLFSMASIFNMQYIDSGYNPRQLTLRDYQRRTSEIRYGDVFAIFSRMGYGLKNYSIFDIRDEYAPGEPNTFLPVHSQLLTDKILHNRLLRTSGWLLMDLFPAWKKSYLFAHDRDNQRTIAAVEALAAEKKDKPFFCYAHLMLPHAPLYKDSTGNYNADSIIANEDAQADKPLYLSYIKYTNQVVMTMVATIRQHDPGAIVVVMSDHGYRSFRQAAGFAQYQFNNICAVYFPDGNYPDVAEKWSNVNFFRYVFNAEFGQNLPYLKDTTVELSY